MGKWRNRMPWVFNFTDEFAEELGVIIKSPLPTISIVIICSWLTYCAKDLLDEQAISAAKKGESTANETVHKLIMDQNDKQLKESALSLSLRLREWFKDIDDRIKGGPNVATQPNISPYYPRDLERFDLEYRVRCRSTRDAMLRRLGPQARDESAIKSYESPLSLVMLKTIADDLERLARMLPTL